MIPVGALVGLSALWLLLSVKVLSEYEWGIIFRFGNLLPRARGRGLVLVAWPIERMVRVSLRTIALRIPSQDLIAAGATTVKADAVVYFRVTDPLRTRVQVENHLDTPTLEVQ